MTRMICGILRLDGGPADREGVMRLARAMVAPGLDHRISVASDGPLAAATVTLAPRGATVAGREDDVIAADGMLLAADLTVHDSTSLPPGATATSRLCQHLLKGGPAALARVHGDFAVAWWQKGRLTLARDHLGTRPISYTHRPGRHVAFASTPAALLTTGLADDTLDENLVAAWLLQPASPPGRSVYRNIHPVAAGHLAEWDPDADRMNVSRYWRLDTRRRLPFSSDPRELAAETRRLLVQAVERRLPANGPGAGHLSGGIDSSSIAVIAARALARSGREFHGYAFCEPESGPGLPGLGDAPFAEAVADAEPSINLTPIPARGPVAVFRDGVEPGTLLPLSGNYADEEVARRAAEHGAGVILTGWGGDQVVSYAGRGAEVELLRSGRLIRLWQALQGESRATGLSVSRLLRSTVVMQALPQALRERVRQLFGRETPFLAAMDHRRQVLAPHRRATALIETWADEGDSHRMRRDSAEAWNPQARLEAFAWYGFRHGVQFAHPLYDLDLVDFAMQVPGIFFRRDGQRRVLFRQALEGILPDPVRLNPQKTAPFPGGRLRYAADRVALLAIFDDWRNDARVLDFLDLDYMSDVVRTAAEPEAPEHLAEADLVPALQIGMLLTGRGRSGDGGGMP